MSIADEIEKLNNLKNTGAISEEEFQEAKRKLLQGNPSAGDMFDKAVGSVDEKIWAMLMHFSLIFIYSGIGIVVPIVLWQIKKNESAFIDQNGKNIVNWIITFVAAAAIFIVLSFVLIGIPLLWLLSLANIVMAIIGGIKAHGGEAWAYPIAIRIF